MRCPVGIPGKFICQLQHDIELALREFAGHGVHDVAPVAGAELFARGVPAVIHIGLKPVFLNQAFAYGRAQFEDFLLPGMGCGGVCRGLVWCRSWQNQLLQLCLHLLQRIRLQNFPESVYLRREHRLGMLHFLHVGMQQLATQIGIGHAFEGQLTILITDSRGGFMHEQSICNVEGNSIVQRRPAVVCNGVHICPMLNKKLYVRPASGKMKRRHAKIVAGIGVGSGF